MSAERVAAGRCSFCGATAPLVEAAVLDAKWSRRFGGEPVVALDHGWYRSTSGRRVQVAHPGEGKYFRPHVRATCDFCTHGWMEDLRWRAEPTVTALAERQPPGPPPTTDPVSLVRWVVMTSVLAELITGLPTASSKAQRHALRAGDALSDPAPTWLFTLRQRLPPRVHLSQVPVAGDTQSLVQIVSVEIAHLLAVTILGSDEAAARVIERSPLATELGRPRDPRDRSPLDVREGDLGRTPHPHRIVVERLCSTGGRER